MIFSLSTELLPREASNLALACIFCPSHLREKHLQRKVSGRFSFFRRSEFSGFSINLGVDFDIVL